jgi:hypothetical protein
MYQLKRARLRALRPHIVFAILSTVIVPLFICIGLQSVGATTTFVVTSADESGPGTLRQAILDANANPGSDLITFNISSPSRLIAPQTALPIISDPVVIDGTTQPGFAGIPLIELSGANIFSSPNTGVLNITAGDTTIRGFVINHFNDRGISITAAGGNHIEGNYIGTDASGTVAASNSGGGNGITIESPNNVIGGTAVSTRNVISGTRFHGISIFGFTASGNLIQGNYIGTNAAGTAAIGNNLDGIFLGTSNNTVGGTVAGARNVISGNELGIEMQVSGTSGNLIQGNYIGTDASGQTKIPNTNYGIAIFNASNNNIVGGTTDAARNVVSGNGWGISVAASNGMPTGNVIQGNYVGVAADGKSPLGNRVEGISLAPALNTTVGGVTAGAGNTIAFNGPTAEIGAGTGIEVSAERAIPYVATPSSRMEGLELIWGTMALLQTILETATRETIIDRISQSSPLQ